MGLQQPSSTDYVLSIRIDEYSSKLLNQMLIMGRNCGAFSLCTSGSWTAKQNRWKNLKIARISLCKDFHYFTVKSIDYIL